MTVISRLAVRAKPAKNHPEFKEWETANVVVLVTASNRDETLARAREVLRREKWELLEVQLCDRIIEECVREQGGAMLEDYPHSEPQTGVMRPYWNNICSIWETGQWVSFGIL